MRSKAFETDYGATHPKVVAKIVADADLLLDFYKYPAESGFACALPTRLVDIRDRAIADQSDQGHAFTCGRYCHDLQGH